MPAITLLTSAGAVRVEGQNLVLDLREVGGAQTEEITSETLTIQGVEGGAQAASAEMEITHSEMPADTAPRRQADRAGEAPSPTSPAPHPAHKPSASVGADNGDKDRAIPVGGSATGRAGGPVCAPVTHSDPAERPSGAIFGERFSHPTSNVTTISSQPAGSVGVPHSKPHKSGELKVQPANLSDPRDPGPIPSWMDKRAKKDVAA